MGPIDEGMLKLPEENASLKCLGFVPAASVSRHYFMDDTFVVVAEPTSAQSNGSVTSLVQAMRNLGQVGFAYCFCCCCENMVIAPRSVLMNTGTCAVRAISKNGYCII